MYLGMELTCAFWDERQQESLLLSACIFEVATTVTVFYWLVAHG